MIKTGIGYDVHQMAKGEKFILGGVEIPSEVGAVGYSDGDALVHAIVDALLGAASLGDIGKFFPSKDDQWKDVVSWTFKVMILAEELNINSKNIDSFLLSEDNEILRLLGEIGSYGDMIELDEKWAYNIIKQIGNYEEVFNRNLGKNSSLNLKRGLNKLYNEGGLLYAPPFR